MIYIESISHFSYAMSLQNRGYNVTQQIFFLHIEIEMVS